MTVFLVVLGLTGAILAYRVPLERLVNPQLFAKPGPDAKPLDLATLAECAEKAEPHARVWYFSNDIDGQISIRCGPRTDPGTGKPYNLQFDHLFMDPWTGAELGKRMDGNLSQGKINLLPFIYNLHASLALGALGSTVLGYIAIVWTIDCFVGFYLTLPLGLSGFLRRWRPAWYVKCRAGTYRLNFDLHRAGGLWLWPLLFIFAWSGVMFTINPVYERITGALFDYDSDVAFAMSYPQHPVENPKMSWRAAQKRGEQLVAEQAKLHGFRVLRPFGLAYIDKLGVYSYNVITDCDFRSHGYGTGVWLDGDTGELKKVWLVSGEHAGNTVSNWLFALHYGDVYELRSYRFAVCLTGVATVVISLTGAYIWWRKRKTRSIADRTAAEGAS